jgi:hypothetical protein
VVTEAAPILRTPSYGIVLREQIRTVFLACWRESAAIVALLAVAAVAAIAAQVGASEEFDGQVGAMPFFVLVGLFSPLVVWKGDKLHGAGYLWTLPVDRRRHALTKAFAGWIWLMLSFAGFIGWLVAVTLLSGGTVDAQDTRLMLPSGWDGEPISGTQLREVPWTTPWEWAVPFTAGTVAYLFGTAARVGLKHPFRWGAGLLLGFFLLTALTEFTDSDHLPEVVLNAVLMGPYGLELAVNGGVGLSTELSTTEGRNVVAWRDYQTAGPWLAATGVWMGLAGLALWAALRRHREH